MFVTVQQFLLLLSIERYVFRSSANPEQGDSEHRIADEQYEQNIF